MVRYNFNEHYFDNIDSSDKAYWIGFIWADGYVCKRDRGNKYEYNLKLELRKEDSEHLETFVKCIDGNYPIKNYKTNSFSSCEYKTARVFITNKYFVKNLYESYGIIPRRNECEKILNKIPKVFYKDFIRGLFDADGTFSIYKIHDNINKAHITFGGQYVLLKWVESVLVENDLIPKFERKIFKRHKEKDGNWVSIRFSGIKSTTKILEWMYSNNGIKLTRKFNKYMEHIKEGDKNAI